MDPYSYLNLYSTIYTITKTHRTLNIHYFLLKKEKKNTLSK